MTATLVNHPVYDTVDLFFRDFFNTSNTYTTPDKSKSSYPVDIYEDASGMHFEIPCVGLEKEDIKVTINSDVLRIVYEKRASEKDEEARKYYCKGVASRSFNLGYKFSSKFNLSEVEARFEKGLLLINIPFSEEGELKEVKIK